ncbi:type IX secretion system outer membrane channel protein PorV [Hymenobacter sp. J193]|uniref:type IX secretion system outer membrane channel protein PorV n=1 Tax=Hymenobacter sp. J193 TaxID=2898429 RepID=UPI002150D0DD|nr:type IX secretion system outer membrane channel protein PorV [Hymenobacter sp. J193]MCR5887420.1 type IX secretion system outer membrane channel protein PorV [Hymenobacter sp. J193]
MTVRLSVAAGLFTLSTGALAQQRDDHAITTAVPVLTLSPDSRSAALGEAGVAISPDANSMYYNAGKLGFMPNATGASLSYAPWLRQVTDDMGLGYLSGYHKVGQRSAFGVSLMYFDLGEINFRDINNADNGTYNPKEYSLSVSYGQRLSENLGVGVAARYIRSNLTGGQGDTRPGNAAAVDLGLYYTKDLTIGAQDYNLALGAAISNIGNKITYTNPEQGNFLPANLKLGTAITKELDAYNKLTLTVDANKLLVPSPYYVTGDTTGRGRQVLEEIDAENRSRAGKGLVSSIFSSFGDAPGGFKEELQEINISAGLEYWYNDLLSARVGYFYEHPQKGARQYLSFGAGLRYQVFGVDAAYLVPNNKNNPLSQTLRVSLHFNFAGAADAASPAGDPAPTN